MAVEPPHDEGLPPAAVEDRRSPDRRQSLGRRSTDRTDLIRTSANAALGICGGLAIVFLFFWALGAIDAGDAVAATIIAILLAIAWVGGFIWRQRHELEARPVNRAERERRGY
jgi:high-affinity Fe2+/Pb2+ permease